VLATLGEVTLDEWIRTLVRCENWIATSSLVYIVWVGVLFKFFQIIFIMTVLIVLLQLILEFYLHVCSFWGTLIFVEFKGEYSLHFHLFRVPPSFTIDITAFCSTLKSIMVISLSGTIPLCSDLHCCFRMSALLCQFCLVLLLLPPFQLPAHPRSFEIISGVLFSPH